MGEAFEPLHGLPPALRREAGLGGGRGGGGGRGTGALSLEDQAAAMSLEDQVAAGLLLLNYNIFGKLDLGQLICSVCIVMLFIP